MTAATQSFNFDARAKGVGPPPFLLLGTLLFWGWQTDFLLVGALMGVILEGSRWIRLKWEFEDEDFRRIWLFCALVLLAAAVYAFTASDALNGFRGMIYNPNIRSERNAGTSLASATASVVKWLPMIFFLFIGAQCFSVRNGIPMETISVLKGWRWRKPRKQAGDTEAGQVMNISYPYLGVCLLAASVHPEEDKSYFWGICVLLGWSL
ncbi:MAG TPA: hypothetical protein VHH88_10720, partial [Verrucomicrobiae bacterium]|nr:hypothetical protein [Verrucomicrobiae bacterium]